MNRKYKKGFTLIELLAVIVILAVIALIATPIIMNVINDSKKGAAKDSGYAIIKAAELMSAKAEFELPIKYTENDELNYKGTKPSKMGLEIDGTGKINLAAFIDGYCIVKGYSDSEVIIDDNKKTADTCIASMNSNIVVDVKGDLVPVTFNTNGETVTADINTAWYDYDTKKWANAVSIRSENRGEYQNVVGKTIDKAHILGYFVYIPRYRYQLWNAEGGVSTEQEIKVEFERRSTPKSIGTKNLEWLTHPAFTFGSDELNGIWVGKFEMTGTNTVPTVIPNEKSLVSINLFNMFNTIKIMENSEYGLDKYDAHTMKNMEWGAAAYLSHSKYGKNGEVWINNVQTTDKRTITGCSASTAAASVMNNMTACELGREYNEEGVHASTTGNITGIYDMSGGSWDRTMGVLVDSAGTPIYSNSGFTKANMPDKKYYDTYQMTTGDFDFSKGKLGDATRETIKSYGARDVGWYSDYSYMIVGNNSWWARGAHTDDTPVTGVFAFYRITSFASDRTSSRAVLALK